MRHYRLRTTTLSMARTMIVAAAILLLTAAAAPSSFSTGLHASAVSLPTLPQPYEDDGNYQVLHKSANPDGSASYLLQSIYRGVPIHGSYLSLDRKAGSADIQVRGEPKPTPDFSEVNVEPEIMGNEAISFYRTALERKLRGKIGVGAEDGDVPEPSATLLIYPFDGEAYLAYEVELRFTLPELGDWVGYIDAHTGRLIDEYSRLSGAQASAAPAPLVGWGKGYNGVLQSFYIKSEKTSGKTVYQMIDDTRPAAIKTLDFRKAVQNKSRPEGFDYIASGSKTFGDAAAVDATVHAKRVYLFYKNRFGRNSIDDKNMDILSFVHVDSAAMRNNAVWTGWAMYYGEATGLKNGGVDCTSCAFDLVAHEMTHGVTQHTVGLEYRGQSGALSESISDIMAAVMDSDDWEIGEDTGAASRSLADPAKYGQPANMSEYVELPEDEKHDNGGVHLNSGIPNRAAYLTALKIDNADIGLKGRDTLGRLTYVLLRDRLLSPTADFKEARDGYVAAASRLSGLTAEQKSALASLVSDAWKAVGIGEPSSSKG